MEIWINPACTKCRVARQALDDAGIAYVERRYLDDVPTVAELSQVLDRMGLQPWDIARPAETRQAGITLPREPAYRDKWLAALVAEPRTIQRPIITADDGTTRIVRDADTLASLIAEARE